MNKIGLGIDLGGTKLAVAIIKEDGEIIDKIVVHDHIGLSEGKVVRYIYDLSVNLLAENKLRINDICGAGVCFPGHLNFKEGKTITTSNLKGFKNYPLRKELETLFNSKIFVDNDANLQAYGENKYGAGRGFDDMIFVTISSGIGAGLILNGKLYRGTVGTAGEVGHMIVDYNNQSQCTCGNRGCWMAHVGGIALPGIAKRYLSNGLKSSVISDEDVLNGKISGKTLKIGLEKKDEFCNRIVSDFSLYSAIGLHNIIQIFNVPLIVLGGGLLNLGEFFLDDIRNKFSTLARDMISEEVVINKVELGEWSGVLGAAALAFDSEALNNN